MSTVSMNGERIFNIKGMDFVEYYPGLRASRVAETMDTEMLKSNNFIVGKHSFKPFLQLHVL